MPSWVKSRPKSSGCSIHNIESSGMELFHQPCSNLGSQLPQSGLIVGVQFKQTDDMLLGDDQRVAFRHRKSVPKSNAHIVFQNDLMRFQIAEGAGHATQCSKSDRLGKVSRHLPSGDF
jgi:hypothetical protein